MDPSSPSDTSERKTRPRVICSTPGKLLNRFVDEDHSLDKLHELISDPVTRESEPWISRLLGDFIRGVGDDGYKLQELPSVMEVLEFLAWRSRDVEQYREHLDKMLKLCALPPLLRTSSENLRSTLVLEQYFNTLGYLIAALPTDREILIVFEAVDSLLLARSKPVSARAVKPEVIRRAAEKSRLAIIVAQLVEISSQKIYLRLLEVAYVLLRVSHSCCYRMLEAGILDNLLIRMDPATGEDDELYKEEMIAGTNVLWALMESILPPNKLPPDLEDLPGPSASAMRSLRIAFRKQVREGRGSSKSLTLRNDLAVLILAALMALPAWHLVRCGLAEDLVILAVSTESDVNGTWAEDVDFTASNDDLRFKKTMLSILCRLSNRGAAIDFQLTEQLHFKMVELHAKLMELCKQLLMSSGSFKNSVPSQYRHMRTYMSALCQHDIMVKRRVVPAILGLIGPAIADSKIPWSTAQFRRLSQFAMTTLAILAPKMPQEFVSNNGTLRLRTLVERSLTAEFDSHMVMELTKTICSIASRKFPHVLNKFRDEEIIDPLIELADRILTFDCLTTQHQRILTFVTITLQDLTYSEERSDNKHKGRGLRMVVQLLRRCLHRNKEDFPLDQRLLITIGSYIWKCVVWCPVRVRKFVDGGGIYTILDVMEEAILPVRCMYLGILTDMCSGGHGAPHLCTWRGADKTKGFMSLLARSWREEEIRTGVKRNRDGCIEDAELPIMGTEQWIQTFHARSAHDFSPALASIVGSVRPKIYAIRKIIMNGSDRFDRSKEHYKILLNDMPVEDLITLCIADHLYRFVQGQLWTEVSRYLEQVGVHLLGMDGEIAFLMNQRHRGWGMYVRGLQDKLLSSERKKEAVREAEAIGRIRDSKLGSALSALEEIDYIRRTTDREHMIDMKRKQRAEINAALRFPGSIENDQCHRTMDEKANFTTILGQYHTIPGVRAGAATAAPLPVSPANSRDDIIPSLPEKIENAC